MILLLPAMPVTKTHLARLGTPSLEIALQQLLDSLCLETRPDRLVPPTKDHSVQPIKLFEPDLGWRVPRGHSHDRGLDQRRWSEIAIADFHDVFYGCEQLNVGAQTTPEWRRGGRTET